jgi:ribokinase
MEIPPEIVRMTIKIAKRNGLFVILNPAPALKLDDETMRCVDVIIPNETEAEYLTGIPVVDEQSLHDAIQYFLGKGIPHCLITLGSKGVAYGGPDGIEHFPALTVDSVDSTAAGDSFIGALAVEVSKDISIVEAIRYCNTVAALTVTKHGAQESLPTREEVAEFLRNEEGKVKQ